ncbi:coil containing protein [Vibrio phage 1.101.O._10N.261.45.C6]|nr:coil containing protein [Vibrio phage 1.101.O._10N.261.45.C6]
MSRADNIAKHRLGVAKKYLRKISEEKQAYYSYDDYESTESFAQRLKYLAEEALYEMEKIK